MDAEGTVRNSVLTDWTATFGGEEHRSIAEDLDRLIDALLDRATRLAESSSVRSVDATDDFKNLWSFGRAVIESGVIRHPALSAEPLDLLWGAAGAKAKLGIRHDFPASPICEAWRAFRRPNQPDFPKTRKRVKDKFDTALWLQTLGIEQAAFLFGGSVTNARTIGARPNLNVPNVHRALARWLESKDAIIRAVVYQGKNYEEIAKALRARWPARGPGSAQSPEHLPPDELAVEVARVLEPVLARILEGVDAPTGTDGANE